MPDQPNESNRPAFPHAHYEGSTPRTARGLTKREHMAALALGGLLANANVDRAVSQEQSVQHKIPEMYADVVVKHVDALLDRLTHDDPTAHARDEGEA